jgi:hypothetical protein
MADNGRIIIENGKEFKELVTHQAKKQGFRSTKDYFINLVESDVAGQPSNSLLSTTHKQQIFHAINVTLTAIKNNPYVNNCPNHYLQQDITKLEELICRMK